MIAIGDSHTWVFRGYCDVKHIDNPTAHNIHKHLETISTSLVKNTKNILSFGDMDCRIHFWYQFKKKENENSLSDLMEETLWRFFQRISMIRRKYKIYILSLPPCGIQGNRFGYPDYANYEQRKMIYFAFNQMFEKFSNDYAFPFVNYYFDVVDENLDRLEEYVADECHLNEKVVPIILEKLK